MPSLARKVLIAAAVDGLFIQPLSTKKEQRPAPPVKIRYGDAAISLVSRDTAPDLSKPNSSFEAFGIVGMSLMRHFLSSYELCVACDIWAPDGVLT